MVVVVVVAVVVMMLLVPHPGLRLLQGERQVAVPVDAFGRRAAVDTQLQVLRFVEGHGHLLWHARRQRQIAAQLTHDHRHADVGGVDLHVVPGRLLDYPQALDLAVPAADGTVHKGSGQVVRHSLVHLLVSALLVGFEDDCDLNEERIYYYMSTPKYQIQNYQLV